MHKLPLTKQMEAKEGLKDRGTALYYYAKRPEGVKRGAPGKHAFSGVVGHSSKHLGHGVVDTWANYRKGVGIRRHPPIATGFQKYFRDRLLSHLESSSRRVLESLSSEQLEALHQHLRQQVQFSSFLTTEEAHTIPSAIDIASLLTAVKKEYHQPHLSKRLSMHSDDLLEHIIEDIMGEPNALSDATQLSLQKNYGSQLYPNSVDTSENQEVASALTQLERAWEKTVFPHFYEQKQQFANALSSTISSEEHRRKAVANYLIKLRHALTVKRPGSNEKPKAESIDEHSQDKTQQTNALDLRNLDSFEDSHKSTKLELKYVTLIKRLIQNMLYAQNAHGMDFFENKLSLSDSPIKQLDLQNYVKVMQVGQGAYGDVWMAEDIVHKQWVALKKLKNSEEREGFPKTATREIILLNSLKHPNIVSLHGVVFSKPRTSSVNNKGNVWMIFEYLPFDVSGYLQALRNTKEKKERFIKPSRWLTIGEIKFIMQQVLRALHFCHKHNIIHRDIKSANLLMDLDGTIKLADFGLARFYDVNIPQLTNRVITLWYRPPELLLGSESYGTPVDMWSVGCILGEMICATPLFAANKESQMLKVIAERIGLPSERDCRVLKSFPLWNQLDLNPVHPDNTDRLHDESSLIEDAVKRRNGAGDKGWDLLKKLLAWSPKDRITAKEALNHEWFKTHPFPEHLKDRTDVRAAHSFQTKNQKYKRNKDIPVKRNDIKHVNAGSIRLNLWLQHSEQVQLLQRESLPETGAQVKVKSAVVATADEEEKNKVALAAAPLQSIVSDDKPILNNPAIESIEATLHPAAASELQNPSELPIEGARTLPLKPEDSVELLSQKSLQLPISPKSNASVKVLKPPSKYLGSPKSSKSAKSRPLSKPFKYSRASVSPPHRKPYSRGYKQSRRRPRSSSSSRSSYSSRSFAASVSSRSSRSSRYLPSSRSSSKRSKSHASITPLSPKPPKPSQVSKATIRMPRNAFSKTSFAASAASHDFEVTHATANKTTRIVADVRSSHRSIIEDTALMKDGRCASNTKSSYTAMDTSHSWKRKATSKRSPAPERQSERHTQIPQASKYHRSYATSKPHASSLKPTRLPQKRKGVSSGGSVSDFTQENSVHSSSDRKSVERYTSKYRDSYRNRERHYHRSYSRDLRRKKPLYDDHSHNVKRSTYHKYHSRGPSVEKSFHRRYR